MSSKTEARLRRRIVPITLALCAAVVLVSGDAPPADDEPRGTYIVRTESSPVAIASVEAAGGEVIGRLDIINAVGAELTAAEWQLVRADDRVLGVNRNGVAKAYPVRILDHHEVVNDDFAGEPIVVTWCPLCYSGMAFTVATTDSRLTFGVSGLLYNSDVLLYDRQTGSLFSQIRSQAISGPLKALKIPAVPLSHTTWRDWRTRFPDTEVLSTDTGFRRNYKVSPYLDYQRSPRLAFPVANRSSELRNKELVLGVELNGRTVAYPFRELKRQEKASFEETFGAENWLVEWSEKDEFARVVDADGNEHPTVIAYWFAWYAFHPDTEVFSAVD